MPPVITDSVLAFLSGRDLDVGRRPVGDQVRNWRSPHSAACRRRPTRSKSTAQENVGFRNKPNAPSGAGAGDFGLERLGFGGGGIVVIIGPRSMASGKIDIAMPPAVASFVALAVRNAKAAPRRLSMRLNDQPSILVAGMDLNL